MRLKNVWWWFLSLGWSRIGLWEGVYRECWKLGWFWGLLFSPKLWVGLDFWAMFEFLTKWWNLFWERLFLWIGKGDLWLLWLFVQLGDEVERVLLDCGKDHWLRPCWLWTSLMGRLFLWLCFCWSRWWISGSRAIFWLVRWRRSRRCWNGWHSLI